MTIHFYIIFGLLLGSSAISFGMQQNDQMPDWSQWATKDLLSERRLRIDEIKKMKNKTPASESVSKKKAFELRHLNRALKDRGVIIPKASRPNHRLSKFSRLYNPFGYTFFEEVDLSECASDAQYAPECKPFDPFFYIYPIDISMRRDGPTHENAPFSLFWCPFLPHSFFERDYFENSCK